MSSGRLGRSRTAILVTLVLAAAVSVVGPSATAEGTTGAPRPDNVGPGLLTGVETGRPVDVVVMLDGNVPTADLSVLRADAAAAQTEVLDEVGPGVEVGRRFHTIPAFTARVESEAALLELAAQPGVLRIDRDAGAGTAALANTVPIISADDLQAAGFTGTGVTVAVLDSGHDLDHPDLDGAATHQACFGENDFVTPNAAGFCPNGLNRQTGAGAAEDDAGHGTHVTGIVRSDGDVSSVGVAPAVSIVAIKVTDTCCFYAFSEITAALDYIVNNPALGVDVVNISLGTTARFSGDCDNAAAFLMAGAAAVANLRAAGVVPVAAPGNGGSTTSMEAPACLSGVLSVGATDTNDVVAGFNDTSTTTDLMAPGVSVTSDAIGGGTTTASGTSMASPAVAGCVALIKEAAPAETPAAIETALETTGVNVTRGGAKFPRINCEGAALSLAYPAHGYPDVPAGSLADLPLRWAKAEAIVVASFPDGGFHPDDPVNRGQIVNMLWTLMDQPPGSPPHGFRAPDVPATAFYNQALKWAKDQGLVTGFTGASFCAPRPAPCYRPRDPVLRGQLVNMAWNMVGAPTGYPPFGYTDIPATAPYRDAMNWADVHDLINEFGTQAQPRRAATRAEVAHFLHRVAVTEDAWNLTPPTTVLF